MRTSSRTLPQSHARRPDHRLIALLAALSLPLGCGDPADAAEAGTFVAQQSDFRDFQQWPRLALPDGPMEGGDPDVTGKRSLYVSGIALGAEAPYPVGTILVKTVEMGAEAEWEVHAMVKRGGTFNSDGAVGWEYFELGLSLGGVPVIRWRGAIPPSGEGYAGVEGLVASDCNSCHAVAPAKDGVLTDL